MRRSVRRGSALRARMHATFVVSCVALGHIVMVPATAHAASCTFDPATHVATATPEEDFSRGTFEVRIFVAPLTGEVFVNSQCGGATVTTLDTINIDLSGIDERVNLTFSFGSGAPLAPGFTDEGNGSSEIEVFVDGTNSNARLHVSVFGSDGSDSFQVGQRLLRPDFTLGHVMNFNGPLDRGGGSVDDDVIMRAIVEQYMLFGGDETDELDGTGTGTLGAGPTAVPIELNGAKGSDLVEGGNGDDDITGSSGTPEADFFAGNGGTDTFDYKSSPSGVRISLNGVADDGAHCPGTSCEGDNVLSIEEVVTGVGPDVLVGSDGPERLVAGEGNNIIDGGGGNDRLLAADGSDIFRGGSGVDIVAREADFLQPTDPGVRVTLDGIADDGMSGEGDNVHEDVEGVVGSNGRDELIGNDGPNRLFGGRGDDVLRGGGGKDVLNGGLELDRSLLAPPDGNDILFGEGGVDTATITLPMGAVIGITLSLNDVADDVFPGNPEWGIDNVHRDIENVNGTILSDTLRGSALANRLAGAGGDDFVSGLGGPDRLLGGPGDDALDGGRGTDTCRQGDGTGLLERCER